jgi:hypothetical protein
LKSPRWQEALFAVVSRNAERSATISNCLATKWSRSGRRSRFEWKRGARQLAVNNTLKCRRIVREEPEAAKASDARQDPLSLSAAAD